MIGSWDTGSLDIPPVSTVGISGQIVKRVLPDPGANSQQEICPLLHDFRLRSLRLNNYKPDRIQLLHSRPKSVFILTLKSSSD